MSGDSARGHLEASHLVHAAVMIAADLSVHYTDAAAVNDELTKE